MKRRKNIASTISKNMFVKNEVFRLTVLYFTPPPPLSLTPRAHRRRKNTEEKAKVVAPVWGQNL